MAKKTFKSGSILKRKRKIGFRERMKKHPAILSRRRLKGRRFLVPFAKGKNKKSIFGKQRRVNSFSIS